MTQETNTGSSAEENSETEVAESIYSGETPELSEEEQASLEEKEAKDESRFKEGQILRFVRVRFPGNAKSFPFLVGKRQIEYGQKVVAMSDRGMAVGYVNSFPYEVPFNKSMLPIRSIAKIATEEDIQKDKEAYHQQKNAENICNDLIEAHQLDMYLTHVEFTSFGKKAIFYFIAPSRVDFRDLVKDLVAKLKTRIELRQISVRDRSASIGGIGPCGRELCCSSFLTKYGNVGIKMAKNQDLTLNFSKLNGVCGQLKCCLQYEDEVYKEKRSRLPKEGDIISTHTNEIGKVLRLHLLSEQFDVITNKGVKKRYVVDLYKESLDKETANFPKEFDSVSDETHKTIGLEESENRKIKKFEAEVKEYKSASKDFAQNVFENLFGVKTLDYSLPEIIDPDSQRSAHIASPDDEEEVVYTPSEDEVLPEDEDTPILYDEPVITTTSRMNQESQRPQRGQRDQRNDNRQSRGNRNNRPSRGPQNPQRARSSEEQSGGGEPRKNNRPFKRRSQNRDNRNRPPK
ncbi:MAG TPA: regulatory iron-sulfur-containing complex subunit RicT [Bacteriovoracaceae bacterium]|nr:regulatory iron-sulfur-containing complex subunit RicT [Bacteriovoracaceae bacterium]